MQKLLREKKKIPIYTPLDIYNTYKELLLAF